MEFWFFIVIGLVLAMSGMIEKRFRELKKQHIEQNNTLLRALGREDLIQPEEEKEKTVSPESGKD